MKGVLDGKVALVTGAGSGIGRACAVAMAADGAKVVVSDITPAEETLEDIRRLGGEAIFTRCDVSKSAEVGALVQSAIKHYGRLDCACNNAGIGGVNALTGDYPEDSWEQVIGVNLTGVWLCTKHEIAAMLEHGGGSIVNMASILGTVGFAGAAAYVSAKHGVLGLTKTAAIEYAPRGIRVNAVCPGFIETPLLEHAGISKGTETYTAIAGLHPMKRMGTPEEVAAMVVWLCSDAASFVTGTSMLVDGGYTAP
ncbi:MAG: SDR family oxidoreductase [Candidatus Krumholzibacteria bacterium]|nr:SDR family oxidoreductase [Candidatus Krumholzibacteria bacterium]MDH4336115.1 SDR family oxidoreductase [Candidatus Krumholzibacteria bacterium]MDH5268756.1 SDR family oxidoreductase [Candidatus Krumholzibacteria bacterium]